MNKIRILSDNLANQIAAGEVVERPASVVKELVENSIDAGAKRVGIDIELGGRRMIKISDDGEGMLRDDAILAFERHATSKIREQADLAAIGTLGFRGEALASVASVAKVELITNINDDAIATKVVIEGGKLEDVKDAARTRGTTISVKELFFNTPARRKFMRSEATENYHLTNIVTHYALAYPHVAFTLTNNGREILRLSTAKDLKERAYQIFGGSMIDSLIPVSGGREYIAKVSGFVSAPRERRSTRDGQYFFVNERYVRDKTISGGLLEGYRSVLPHGVYPVAFLFLEVPLEEIDVNVHPAKTEVRFRRSEAIKDVVAEAVKEALAKAGIRVQREEREEQFVANERIDQLKPYEDTRNIGAPELPVDVQPSIDFMAQSEGRKSVFESHASEFLEPNRLPGNEEKIEFSEEFNQYNEVQNKDKFALSEPFVESSVYPVLPPVNSAEKLFKTADVGQIQGSKIRPVSQLHDSFIIAVDDEGLLLIDQHVAHERILFDKFRKKEVERKIESQQLLLPETLDLSPAQAMAYDLVESELEDLGFGIMRLSGRTIAIRSVPTDVRTDDARNLLKEVLDVVENEKRGNAKAALRDNIAATLACKAAVKINMKLTPEKMQWLIDRLLFTSSPTTCPHGRPVILRLTMKDIEKGFHRT